MVKRAVDIRAWPGVLQSHGRSSTMPFGALLALTRLDQGARERERLSRACHGAGEVGWVEWGCYMARRKLEVRKRDKGLPLSRKLG